MALSSHLRNFKVLSPPSTNLPPLFLGDAAGASHALGSKPDPLPGRTMGKSKRLRADRTLYLAWWGLPASGTAPSPHATRPFSSSTTVALLDLIPKPASLNSQSLYNFYQRVSVSFCPIPSPIGAKIQFFRPDRGLPSCSTQVPPFKKKKISSTQLQKSKSPSA